jgi:hypothetical protein
VALEVDTTAYNDAVNSTVAIPVLIGALQEQPHLWKLCRDFTGFYAGRGTSGLTIPKDVSFFTAGDNGESADTEFNAAEATDLSNTAASTTAATLTTGEVGIAVELTDTLKEDSVFSGAELAQILTGKCAHAVSIALEVDFLGLLAGISSSKGASGVPLQVANMVAAQIAPRQRGLRAEMQAFILGSQQSDDLDNNLITTNAAAATYVFAADRALGYRPTDDHGMLTRHTMDFRNRPVFCTGLVPTANAGADEVGGCIVPSTPLNDSVGATTFGMGWKRMPRVELDRLPLGRADQIVVTARAGFCELQDGSAEGLTTRVSA